MAKNAPVLVVSMHSKTLFAERARLAGAAGYLTKQESAETICDALRVIVEGGVYFGAPLSTQEPADATGLLPLDSLGNRELEVFRLVGEGRGYPHAP